MFENPPPTLKDYTFIRLLGKGGFSQTYVAKNNSNNEEICVKVIPKQQTNSDQNSTISPIIQEVNALSSIQHPCIAGYKSSSEDYNYVYILQELCHGKNLLQLINENGVIPDNHSQIISYQLLTTLQFLHENQICHRDIKPENIIVDSNYNIKLIDFGLSTINDNSRSCHRICGSAHYLAPEVILKKSYTIPPTDIWSAGITIYAMVNGTLPWRNINPNHLFSAICTQKIIQPSRGTPECARLIMRMLIRDPDKRPTAEQCLHSSWFKNLKMLIPPGKILKLNLDGIQGVRIYRRASMSTTLNQTKIIHNDNVASSGCYRRNFFRKAYINPTFADKNPVIV